MKPVLAGACALLLAGAGAAMAQGVPDLRGNWIPGPGAHIIDGPTRHIQGGSSAAVPGHDSLRRHTSAFVLRFEGQDGRSFWGTVTSPQHTERLIGVLSNDGRRFVMVDEDGEFDGTLVDNDTLDYCYRHITPTTRAVACGLLLRQR